MMPPTVPKKNDYERAIVRAIDISPTSNLVTLICEYPSGHCRLVAISALALTDKIAYPSVEEIDHESATESEVSDVRRPDVAENEQDERPSVLGMPELP